ncbi:MAG: hypothetical protein H0X50_09845 [Nitrosopumilus sp.]|nr:hypothetical protein [Nitrosopumilus sp.]
MVFNGNMEFAFAQISQLNYVNTKLQTNSLNLSEPMYQAITGDFLATKELSSGHFTSQKNISWSEGL